MLTIDLGLSGPLSWRTTAAGTVTFRLRTQKLEGASRIRRMFPSPRDLGGVHPRVQKELADVTAGPLSIICQRSCESGEVPADWKLVNIIAIDTKGARK